ncbi:MAG: acyl-CoA thioesterase [Acidobacteria bacterium]|nr:MAG: acyl-CoA thioesterase [Acidobacteriota bacterium]
MADEPQAKPASESQVEMTEIVNPEDTNPMGTIFGGRVMALMDKAAAVASMRHCRKTTVTVSVDRINFINPIRLGDIVILLSSVNQAFRTSMEVGVKVFSEDPRSGRRQHTCTAYLTFVALDDDGRPARVPGVILETEEQRRRARDAEERRSQRAPRR